MVPEKNGIFSVQSMYKDPKGGVISINKPLWKLKLPLKVKFFPWFLHRGVILTKDNLARQNWHYSNNETIQHLFFECHMARLIWIIIHTTFGLQKPNNVIHMFGIWLQGIRWKEKNLIFIGVSVRPGTAGLRIRHRLSRIRDGACPIPYICCKVLGYE
jgi:hypothetical protein